MTKYYYFGSTRVAMNVGGTVYYLHNDHLSGTNVVTNQSGGFVSRQTYYAFGTIRTVEGTTPTDYGFTGQKFDSSDALMYYGTRYYDPQLGRFLQADTIMAGAGNPQHFNRYSYTLNNPLRYMDPSGHMEADPNGGGCDPSDPTCNGGGNGGGNNCDPYDPSCGVGTPPGSGSGNGGGNNCDPSCNGTAQLPTTNVSGTGTAWGGPCNPGPCINAPAQDPITAAIGGFLNNYTPTGAIISLGASAVGAPDGLAQPATDAQLDIVANWSQILLPIPAVPIGIGKPSLGLFPSAGTGQGAGTGSASASASFGFLFNYSNSAQAKGQDIAYGSETTTYSLTVAVGEGFTISNTVPRNANLFQAGLPQTITIGPAAGLGVTASCRVQRHRAHFFDFVNLAESNDIVHTLRRRCECRNAGRNGCT
ncbi:MAG: RHS repeat-associated core domain-containing protein, partial [Anaerolineae bacterium]